MGTMARVVAFLLALVSFGAGAAVEVAGVKFEDRAKLGSAELALNGAGLRTRFFIKVYAMALYVTEKKTAADAVIALPGAKRIHIVTLRELTAQQFVDALVEGMQKNLSEAEFGALKPQVEEFKSAMLAIKVAPEKAVVLIDYQPDSGTQLIFNGQAQGKAITGEAFHRALLRVWLGTQPAQDDLKDALVGK